MRRRTQRALVIVLLIAGSGALAGVSTRIAQKLPEWVYQAHCGPDAFSPQSPNCPVDEPGSWALFVIGVGAAWLVNRRRR